MPPRFRSSLGLACLFLVVYFVLTNDEVNFGNPLPPVDLPPLAPINQSPPPNDEGHLVDGVTWANDGPLPGAGDGKGGVAWVNGPPPDAIATPDVPAPSPADDSGIHLTGSPVETPWDYWGTATMSKAPGPTPAKEINFAPTKLSESWGTDTARPLQEQFREEYEKLEGKVVDGQVYGNTLTNMISSGIHAGFKATALSSTGKSPHYTDKEPLMYNPYPDYTGDYYKAHNQGEYIPCEGPEGNVQDVMVFSGHPKIFGYPPIGAYYVLDIDSNLCFERETRLGQYGHAEEGASKIPSTNWDTVDWGSLQEKCSQKNAARFGVPITTIGTLHMSSKISSYRNGTINMKRAQVPKRNVGKAFNAKVRRAFEKENYIERSTKQTRQDDNLLHGMPTKGLQIQTRAAVLLRAKSGKEWSENDKQNMRSLITELSLRSGGEYQVFLIVQVTDNSVPIHSDPAVYSAALHENVPEEFWSMTILYNDEIMKQVYPNIAFREQENYWLPVQKFAQEYPNFDYYWNWELNSRYTGHYYKLLENLGMFADMQPRKGLWERNERFYIPQVHGAYDSQFRYAVELKYTGSSTVWGAQKTTSVSLPLGPIPPADSTDDNYEWGLHEHADFISLSPIFNPIGTKWKGKDDIWGYDGEETPRRATTIPSSRLSKKLLEVMHSENSAGNHISADMAPGTVALLHGLKAVYAPHPIFVDREWDGRSLERWFNPGENGESGSSENSPFSDDNQERFKGFSWGKNGEISQKMYNHWLGLEDGGIGGLEWEYEYGRICLPPVLLYPIDKVERHQEGYSSTPTTEI